MDYPVLKEPAAAPFRRELEQLESVLPARESARWMLEQLRTEAGAFGKVRSEGDPTSALRLLAFDGLLTELLGNQVAEGKTSKPELEDLCHFIGIKEGFPADNQRRGR